MPTARDALLDAAFIALADRPWSGVRMVDVASSAGVSRQTLYNEFGSKDGLARALVLREADAYLAGVERALAERSGDLRDRLLSVAEWTAGAARANPLVRALLTGCWGERLPAPHPAGLGAGTRGPPSPGPAQRRADIGTPAPAELIAAVRDKTVAAEERGRSDRKDPRPSGDSRAAKDEAGELAYRCELTVRLALSYVVAPASSREEFGRLIGAALAGGAGVSGPSPRAAGR
ncbi:TetR/AcrR family transcriptional regulator [Streptomyces sp. H27-C3]|uniref:TetR/AcrR family transcriptional regulator n=1 Tax=Streptomyces sp. H27-C3 TaxID=3046305 RepID=UPI0024B99D9E|nr:TetR/AcrR family transcriptional regulator [Streptomyces sp. H27-C3]MDJ0462138.1 TetR/AcrR family transcriptional regulator [Streptomyces sp. H27-C3]